MESICVEQFSIAFIDGLQIINSAFFHFNLGEETFKDFLLIGGIYVVLTFTLITNIISNTSSLQSQQITKGISVRYCTSKHFCAFQRFTVVFRAIV